MEEYTSVTVCTLVNAWPKIAEYEKDTKNMTKEVKVIIVVTCS